VLFSSFGKLVGVLVGGFFGSTCCLVGSVRLMVRCVVLVGKSRVEWSNL
jgi:hypothetical protein